MPTFTAALLGSMPLPTTSPASLMPKATVM